MLSTRIHIRADLCRVVVHTDTYPSGSVPDFKYVHHVITNVFNLNKKIYLFLFIVLTDAMHGPPGGCRRLLICYDIFYVFFIVIPI